ncbi:aspartyl-phosphate phosphatase Spo0E family protein [Paenibacillus profundus]|uniref:Aspartyl-phosphate phosphatase Spo0E family protein n=1 Tax=Paenibacillus profundus TaxID=1173085 RepID=A0ABS8YBF3_9BACL|nr:aspartyl-phosphate phosphatase Spo0E family protein [Paenibacillus profundus]MCE5168297.1 aspartyl-phosphate phosphatase Spo0E family protein [Paenibacillus profundus]
MVTQDEDLVLIQKVEDLRQRLIRTVGSIKSFNDERVVELSQELDYYVLQLQKRTINIKPQDDKQKIGLGYSNLHEARNN